MPMLIDAERQSTLPLIVDKRCVGSAALTDRDRDIEVSHRL